MVQVECCGQRGGVGASARAQLQLREQAPARGPRGSPRAPPRQGGARGRARPHLMWPITSSSAAGALTAYSPARKAGVMNRHCSALFT